MKKEEFSHGDGVINIKTSHFFYSPSPSYWIKSAVTNIRAGKELV